MSLEGVYSTHWLWVVYKGSRCFNYLLVLAWLIWFTRTSGLKVKTVGVLLFIGLPLVLAGIFVDLLGEFFPFSPLLKRVIDQIILINVDTALILYSLVVMVIELARASRQYQHKEETTLLLVSTTGGFFAEAERMLKEAQAGKRSPALASRREGRRYAGRSGRRQDVRGQGSKER